MQNPLDSQVDIGHVHLKVADLDRAIAFYSGVLGFEVMQRMGNSAAFLSAGGYHHHIGLNTWESQGGSPPAPGTTGLYHFAIRYPSRAALGDALLRLDEAGVRLDGASDHGVSEALYLAIRTRTGWSCTPIGRVTSGRGTRTDRCVGAAVVERRRRRRRRRLRGGRRHNHQDDQDQAR